MLENDNHTFGDPNPDEIFPVKNSQQVTYIKPTLHNPISSLGNFRISVAWTLKVMSYTTILGMTTS